jgi:hypothetical protein
MNQGIRSTVCDAIENVLKRAGVFDTRDAAHQINEIARTYYDVPDGIIELRCEITGWSGKPEEDEMKMSLVASNAPTVLAALGRIGKCVTLRGLQTDIEAFAEKREAQGDGQTDIDDLAETADGATQAAQDEANGAEGDADAQGGLKAQKRGAKGK